MSAPTSPPRPGAFTNAEKRSIWGEASRDDARALSDDGIPVAPVPWMRRGDS